ncbi:MAG: hypothetical protein H0V89_02090 [Deltaproteobacteria bacterium]|nr:hypothetical protein [Deltaproteobacteria bacterium]
MTGGDLDPNDRDLVLAHYDANGALLGVITLLGDGPQSSLSLAARPAGGVDWAVAGAGGTVADSAGKGLRLDSERSVVRAGSSGLVEAALPVDGLHSFRNLAYVGGDLVALLTGPRPLTVPDWASGSATAVVVPDGPLFNGLATWQAGTAPVELEAVQWYSGNGTFAAGIGGTAVGDFMSGDMELLPDTFAIELDTEVPYTESSGRPGAVAWPPDRALACAVDLEPDGESWAGLTSEIAVAVDEAGGLWLGGTFREMSLTVEEPPGAVLDAKPSEDDQGFLVRWQLWPGVPGPTLP